MERPAWVLFSSARRSLTEVIIIISLLCCGCPMWASPVSLTAWLRLLLVCPVLSIPGGASPVSLTVLLTGMIGSSFLSDGFIQCIY